LISVEVPSPHYCKLAETKELQNHSPQTSRNKRLIGKVSETKELRDHVTSWPF
jgi:hypothetical protein